MPAEDGGQLVVLRAPSQALVPADRVERLRQRLELTQSLFTEGRASNREILQWKQPQENGESQLPLGIAGVLKGCPSSLEEDSETAASNGMHEETLAIKDQPGHTQALSTVADLWKQHLETVPNLACLGFAAEFKRWASVTPEAAGCDFHTVDDYLRTHEAAADLESSTTPTSTSVTTPWSADLESASGDSALPSRTVSGGALQLELLLRNEQRKAQEQHGKISHLERQLREQTMRSVHKQVRLTELRRTQCALETHSCTEDSETADLTDRLSKMQRAFESQQESNSVHMACLRQEIEDRSRALQLQVTRNRYLEGELRCLEASSTSELRHMSATMQMHKDTISRLEGVLQDSVAMRFAESFAHEEQSHELKARVGLLEASLAQRTGHETLKEEWAEVQRHSQLSEMREVVSGQRAWVMQLLELLEPAMQNEDPEAVVGALSSHHEMLRRELCSRKAALLEAEASLSSGGRGRLALLALRGGGQASEEVRGSCSALEEELAHLRQELQSEQQRHLNCEARLQQELAAVQEERASLRRAESEQALECERNGVASMQLFDECLAAERQLHAETRAEEQSHMAGLRAELESLRRKRARQLARRRSERRDEAEERPEGGGSAPLRPRSERRAPGRPPAPRQAEASDPADEAMRRRRRVSRTARQDRRLSQGRLSSLTHYVGEEEEEDRRLSQARLSALTSYVGEEDEDQHLGQAAPSTLNHHVGEEDDEDRHLGRAAASALARHVGELEDEAPAAQQEEDGQ